MVPNKAEENKLPKRKAKKKISFVKTYKKFVKTNKRLIIIILAIIIGIMILAVLGYGFIKIRHSLLEQSKDSKSNKNQEVVLTKDAVDVLVKKAANQQYLQDVLTSGPSLPSPKHKANLVALQNQPTQQLTMQPQQLNTGVTAKDASDSQHCNCSGQVYSIGEIVHIDKGWARCTPSVVVHPDGSSQYGNAVWTLRDNLLN